MYEMLFMLSNFFREKYCSVIIHAEELFVRKEMIHLKSKCTDEKQ